MSLLLPRAQDASLPPVADTGSASAFETQESKHPSQASPVPSPIFVTHPRRPVRWEEQATSLTLRMHEAFCSLAFQRQTQKEELRTRQGSGRGHEMAKLWVVFGVFFKQTLTATLQGRWSFCLLGPDKEPGFPQFLSVQTCRPGDLLCPPPSSVCRPCRQALSLLLRPGKPRPRLLSLGGHRDSRALLLLGALGLVSHVRLSS